MSTRAAAESAARAGFRVTALDAFADRDQHPGVRALSLPRHFGRPFSAAAAAAVAREIDADAVAYLSPFDNHPRAVALLGRGRTLWGNPAHVLRRVRNPVLLERALRSRGLPSLAVRTVSADAPNALRIPGTPDDAFDRDEPGESWLLKPLRSGGGHGVQPYRGRAVPRGWYLQRRAEGTSASSLFAAAGGRIVPLGISRQLVGDAAFGAGGYRYCGNIVSSADGLGLQKPDEVLASICRVGRAVAEEFGLVGVNGIDFVTSAGVPFTVEVNPRPTGVLELVERWSGVSILGAHAAACAAGALPPTSWPRAHGSSGAIGRAIVFARADVEAGETGRWLDDGDRRDVPQPGERIPSGHPICSVLASGRSVDECHAALARAAERVYEDVMAKEGT